MYPAHPVTRIARSPAISVAGDHRLIVRKPAQRRSLQKPEMRDRRRKLLEATLSVGDLGSEKILMIVVERLAFKVVVGPVSERHGRERQHILNPPAKARMFLLCLVQSMFDGFQNGPDAQPIGFCIPFG